MLKIYVQKIKFLENSFSTQNLESMKYIGIKVINNTFFLFKKYIFSVLFNKKNND